MSGKPARRAVIGAAAVVGVGVLAYGVDWATSAGEIPRGVTVAAVSIGGMTPEAAVTRLQDELGPREAGSFTVTGAGESRDFAAADLGLSVDWDATVDRAGDQPINPFTRVLAFFSDREVGYTSIVDGPTLDEAVTGLKSTIDRQAVEGNIVFAEASPTAVAPREGRTLDPGRGREAILENWLSPEPIELPVDSNTVSVTREGLDRAMREYAEPAVATELVVRGEERTEAVLVPAEVGRVLTFEPDGDGGLNPLYSVEAAEEILSPQLAETETAGVNATVRIVDSRPEVVPSRTGRAVDWEETLKDLPALMQRTTDRSVDAVYGTSEPSRTTEEAEALGIKEVISEFTTGGFASNSGVNIRRAAEQANGAIVEPGETFSLNGHTGPRGYDQGYVDAGIILSGRPAMAVGGGVSQFTTTLYNASYFAGLEDVEHTEHSYYISRYPAGREATIFDGSIDLKFRNQYDTGVLIESFGDESSVTVRLWGTKTVEVESINGGRYNYTSPPRLVLRAGPNCLPSGGGQGFTTDDTRVIRDAQSGEEISRETRTVTYVPQPNVVCEVPPPPPPPPATEEPDEPAEPAEDEPSAPAEPPAEPPADEPPPPVEPPAEPEG